MRRRRNCLLLALLAVVPLLVTACGGSSADEPAAEPAVVERIAGTDVYRIRLSEETARRLALKTVAVQTDGGKTAIPYRALLYSPAGEASVYVSSAPLIFERQAVVVDHIAGDRAVLSQGPPTGTRVATTGVSELHGMELAAGGGSSRALGPVFDPVNFGRSATVDNEWLPLRPGTKFVFTGKSADGEKRLVFIVTDLVKVVGGVRSAVVWDRDYTDGELVEAELAFFAQDDDGNVWHTGEYPEEYEGGRVVGIPAWLAGVNGATAGIEMNAQPRLGTPVYAQGYAPPPVSWNDHAQVFATGRKTCVPYRCYRNVLVTREFNPDEPGSQLKYFAAGVGNIRVGWLSSKEKDKEVLVLTDVVRLGPAALGTVRAEALKLEQRAYRSKPRVYGGTKPAKRRG
jgi:hypothetical protein